MKRQLLQSMADAGQEERCQAIANNQFHQGVCCCGWRVVKALTHTFIKCKECIFGLYMKKLLFLAVRNKYCSVCAVAENKGQDPQQHTCYRNWNGAMESDIIAEGFRLYPWNSLSQACR